VGRLTASRPRRSPRASGSFLTRCGTPTGFSCCTRTPAARPTARRTRPTDLDRGRSRRLGATVEEVTERLDAFDATTAARSIAAFVDDLSNWYVRRSRPPLLGGRTPPRFATLRQCLRHHRPAAGSPSARLSPTRSTTTFRRSLPSVHLTTGRSAPARDRELEAAMTDRKASAVALGLRARAGAKIGLRRPLREAVVVVAAGRERASLEAMADIVARRAQRQMTALRRRGRRARLLRAQAQQTGRWARRFGKLMPQAAAPSRRSTPNATTAALRQARLSAFTSTVVTTSSRRGPAHRPAAARGLPGRGEGGHAVALDLAMDDELRREGVAR